MACLNEPPNPPRVWSRVENVCETSIDQMSKKANILQYKQNSANLTKNQKYSQLIQHPPHVWATQNQSVTIPDIGIPTNCVNTIICVPTTSSGVPGKKMMLCSKRNETQLYYPRIRYNMGNTNNQFPDGYKFI